MIEPRRATLPVTIDLPWEIAELVVQHGPALIQALETAVRIRQVVVMTRAASESAHAASPSDHATRESEICRC